MTWGWLPVAAYFGVGAMTNFLCVQSWRKEDDWVRDWSDWLFVGFILGLALWPFMLPYEIRDRVKARRGIPDA